MIYGVSFSYLFFFQLYLTFQFPFFADNNQFFFCQGIYLPVQYYQMRNKIEEGSLKPTPKVIFDKGESIKVIEGPFENFTGVVEEVKMEKGKIQVLVEIFGRATPIDLDFNQVEKI
ncbi:hypothetical protein HOD02_03880 [bacterium]|nr:hypothetical protein [bacterium]